MLTQTFQPFIDDVYRDLDLVVFYLVDILVSSYSLDEHLEHIQPTFSAYLTMPLSSTQQNVNLVSQKRTSWATPLAQLVSVPTLPMLTLGASRLQFHMDCAPHVSKYLKQPGWLWQWLWCWLILSRMLHPTSQQTNQTLMLELCLNSSLIDNGNLFHSFRRSWVLRNWNTVPLAAYLAVWHFQYFVEGRVFRINTDHKPFIFVLHFSAEWHSTWQARYLAFISEFTTTSAIPRVKLIALQMHCPAMSLPWNSPQSTSTSLLLHKRRSSSSFPTPPFHCRLRKYHFQIPDVLFFAISPKVVLWLSSGAFCDVLRNLWQPALFVSSWHQGFSSSDIQMVCLAQYEARHCLLDQYLPWLSAVKSATVC